MVEHIRAFAAPGPGRRLEPFVVEVGPLAADDVDVTVEHCGICHSDISMIDNEWGETVYPLVAGHEIIGRINACGLAVPGLKVGQRVGIGWFSRSCMVCEQCMSGDYQLCRQVETLMVARHGGFSERVRRHWAWVSVLPEALAPETSGPLFCAGSTVFSPIADLGVRPTDHVGVIGVGGLGHLAVQFLRAWGCAVTAFTSHNAKESEIRRFGAHAVVDSHDAGAVESLAGTLDFLLVTTSAALDWQRYLQTLAPRGRLHFVGAVLKPLDISPFGLIGRQRQVSGSPLGRPTTTWKMLEFAGRHQVAPQVEHYPMSQINEALDHVRAGKARYRVVLDADF